MEFRTGRHAELQSSLGFSSHAEGSLHLSQGSLVKGTMDMGDAEPKVMKREC